MYSSYKIEETIDISIEFYTHIEYGRKYSNCIARDLKHTKGRLEKKKTI